MYLKKNVEWHEQNYELYFFYQNKLYKLQTVHWFQIHISYILLHFRTINVEI